MQRYPYSKLAILTIALTLVSAGWAIYLNTPYTPYILIFIFTVGFYLTKTVEAYTNKARRRKHRFEMDNALVVLPHFHADETYHTEYNGFVLQVDQTRGQLVLIDHTLHIERFHFDEITSCYYETKREQHVRSTGNGFERAPDTYSQLSLVLETNRPGKERLTYICFDTWFCTNRMKRTVLAKNVYFAQALEEVKLAVERIEAIKD